MKRSSVNIELTGSCIPLTLSVATVKTLPLINCSCWRGCAFKMFLSMRVGRLVVCESFSWAIRFSIFVYKSRLINGESVLILSYTPSASVVVSIEV